MEDYFLKLIEAEKSFGETEALKGVGLGLYKGRTVGILGTHGSGKTVLARLICGIEKPDGGKVLLGGKRIKKQQKKEISFLIDDSYIKKFKQIKKVFEFYEMFYADFDRKKALELLRIFGVEAESASLNNRGVCQLVALACFAARKAELYVLDEPLTYFDRGERETYLKTAFKSLENKPLIVICTEFLRGIEPLLDDVVFMHDGMVKHCKTAEEIRLKTGRSVEDLYKEVFGGGGL